MKKLYSVISAAFFFTLIIAMPLQADDTDIYLNQTPAGQGDAVVIFTIDWRPNLASTICADVASSCDQYDYLADKLGADPDLPTAGEKLTFFDVIRLSLKVVLNEIEQKGVDMSRLKLGLMINHSETNNCAGPNDVGCSNGGYVLHGAKAFDVYGSDFFEKLSDIPLPQGNESHPFQGKELYFEMFRYLTGQDIYNGHLGYLDYGDKEKTDNLNVDNPGTTTLYDPDVQWDESVESNNNKTYVSPLTANCSKVFAVNLMFQVSQQEDGSDSAIEGSLSDGGMDIDLKLDYKADKYKSEYSKLIRWMRDVDLADGSLGNASNLLDPQNLVSYFLVDPNQINTTTNDYARAGGTGGALALSDDPEELVATLSDIFTEILSISTTFVSASVPVNSFNRAEIVDNVYIALFQPLATPRWAGNVKKLKIQKNDLGITELVDATGTEAIALDGRISYSALTYWTDAATLPYPDTNISGPEADQVISGKDGRFVPRGGAGQKTPGIPGSGSTSPGLSNSDAGARQLFTEPTSGTTLMALNADTSTASDLMSDLNAADTTEAETLLRYARGIDVNDEDGDDSVTDARLWLMGDSLHSRPLAINYGARTGYSTDNPDIRILVGGNDGYMRMNRNTTSAGGESGSEVWAFMPRLAMQNLARLMANNAGSPVHPYSVDGPATAYVCDANQNGTIDIGSDNACGSGGDKVYLFFGMRRGGKAYYALDISNPDSPKFLWTITKAGDFEELGLTFSQPQTGLMAWTDGTTNPEGDRKPVVIFGGGYDVNKDTRGVVGTDDSEGRAIFVVDAATGKLVWKATYGASASASNTHYQTPALVDSIPSTIAVADTTGDGLIDRFYVGDTGGNVWRGDMSPSNTRDNWTLTKILSAGRHYVANITNDRRFFHPPDIVKTKDGSGAYDAVIIGSGDRAYPLGTGTVNWIYMIKDRNTTTGILSKGYASTNPASLTAYTPSNLLDVTDNCLQIADDTSTCDTSSLLQYGWRLQLEECGEKSLSSPVTIGGSIFMSTYLPQCTGVGDLTTCGPAEGRGRLYALDLQEAGAVNNYYTPNDVIDPVTGEAKYLFKRDRYRDLLSGGIPSEVVVLPPNEILTSDLQIEETPGVYRGKTYWYEVLEE